MVIIAKESDYQIVHIRQIFDNWYILRWYKKNHKESLRKILKIKIHCRTFTACLPVPTNDHKQLTSDDRWLAIFC